MSTQKNRRTTLAAASASGKIVPESITIDIFSNDYSELIGYVIGNNNRALSDLVDNDLRYHIEIDRLVSFEEALGGMSAGEGFESGAIPEEALSEGVQLKLNGITPRSPIELTDGFIVSSGSKDKDILIYTGENDITIQLGMPTGKRVVDIYNLSSTGSISINSVISNSVNTVLPASSTSKHVQLYYSNVAWFVIQGADNLVSAPGLVSEFDSAYIDDANSNKLKVKFTRDITGIKASDFLLFDSHCRIIDERHPDWNPSIHTPTKTQVSGGYEVAFVLDDYVLSGADEAPSVYYFSKSGSLKDAASGNKVASFTNTVLNNANSYNGSKTLQKYSSGQTIPSSLSSNTIYALQRGGTFNITNLKANSSGCVITAYGSGALPVVTSNGNIEVRNTNRVVIANIKMLTNDHGIRTLGSSSFCYYSSCELEYTGSGDNHSGIVLFFGHSADSAGANLDRNKKNEGQTAVNNTITGFGNGISSKLQYVDETLTWEDRKLSGNRTPFRIEANSISCDVKNNQPEGDGIAMARGRYYWSIIRNNDISSWGDDGIDLYGGNQIIVEYNKIHNESSYAENGGRGIKCGGEGGGGGEDDRSGSNIIRYNVIYKLQATLAGGGTSGACNAIDTNGMRGISAHADVNEKTLIYGNLVYGVPQHAFQFTGSNGLEFELFNNLFIGGAGGNGINFYNSSNVSSLYVRNCIINTTNANFDGNYNIFTGSVGTYITGSFDQTGVSLSSIFDDVVDIKNADILEGSPTINAGVSIGYYQSDYKDVQISQVNNVDIGPIEYIS